MVEDNSDSSCDEDAGVSETSVLLGYASEEPTEDSISQLGGIPVSFVVSSKLLN